jgi:serine/threonine protein kinase
VLSERYRIERLIGEGGMGAVYLAEHVHMHKRLAVKVLHPEMSRLPEIVARFEREAMAAGQIDHPNIATASDFGKLPDGSFFLVLEYVEGKNLRDVLNGSALELGRALHITHQIAEALGRAHTLGIVHRDLKPENVMILERDGDPDFVKVLDFGICVPTPALVESTTGDGARDAEVNRILGVLERAATVLQPPDEATARRAARLRYLAKTDDGIDALVAAAAVGDGSPAVVLTSDPDDLDRLLRDDRRVSVRAV